MFQPKWKVDCNELSYRKDKEGKKIPYATPPGPSELIGTPVLYEDKIYCAIGQDPEHGDGVGRLSCIDASTGKVIWKYLDVGRTISTASVHEGLVYIAEYAGIIHCLDAETGKLYWTHDSFSRIWGSTLVADGKVLLGNEDGDLLIIDHGKDKPKVRNRKYGSTCLQFSSRCQQYSLCCHADSPLRHWEIFHNSQSWEKLSFGLCL